MDITKLSNPKKLELCKWYYTVTLSGGFAIILGPWVCVLSLYAALGVHGAKFGCFLLPFVWFVNAVWFFHEAFLKPPYEEQKAIKKYVILSSVGTIIFAIVFISWMVTFQLKREAWGPAADAISFIVPRGRA